MRIAVHTNDGGTLDVEDFNQESFMDLTEAFELDRVRLLAFALNDGMAYIPKAAVTRIDVFD